MPICLATCSGWQAFALIGHLGSPHPQLLPFLFRIPLHNPPGLFITISKARSSLPPSTSTDHQHSINPASNHLEHLPLSAPTTKRATHPSPSTPQPPSAIPPHNLLRALTPLQPPSHHPKSSTRTLQPPISPPLRQPCSSQSSPPAAAPSPPLHPPLHPPLRLDCTRLRPPPDSYRRRMTGLDDALRRKFLSNPAARAFYKEARAILKRRLEEAMAGGGEWAALDVGGGWDAFSMGDAFGVEGGWEEEVECEEGFAGVTGWEGGWEGEEEAGGTVLVFCEVGMHRSVAIAERLAEWARGWEGVRVRVRQLDLRRNMRRDGILERKRVERKRVERKRVERKRVERKRVERRGRWGNLVGREA
ncbi:hypothetical protein MMC13_001086 [Lambiella insularis]|nr:hypothetical protein [Lambiella insularis]